MHYRLCCGRNIEIKKILAECFQWLYLMYVFLNFYVMEKIVSLLEVFCDYACLAIFCAAVFFFLLWLAVKLRIFSFLVFIVLGIVHMVIIAIGRFLLFVVDKSDARAMKIFEKRIGNSGLKEEIDVGKCHAFLNSLSRETIEFYFSLYQEKAEKSVLEGKNGQQLERYLSLLEIMRRYLEFRRVQTS